MYPSLHVTAAPPRVGSLHRAHPVLRIIPEHQRGLHTGEASEVCHGFTPPNGGRVSPGTASTHFPLDNPANRRDNGRKPALSPQAMRPLVTWRVLMTVHGMHREASIEIHASPEAVYDLVSALPRMGEWSPENIGGEWQGGGSGQVGDRFLGHNRAGERAWSVPVMVT